MGNAWYVLPLTIDLARHLAQVEGVPAPSDPAASTAPTPNQVLAALESFPEYRVTVHRWDRKRKEDGQAIYIKVKRADGSSAITFDLLGIIADDQPAGTFAFNYYQETKELVRLASKLAESCGPLALCHDGGETSVVVDPSNPAEVRGASRAIGFCKRARLDKTCRPMPDMVVPYPVDGQRLPARGRPCAGSVPPPPARHWLRHV
ncbi:MAG TPA: hypothetical protein VGY66_28655 [Gemmataceae bacterium]|nr:hypothetical protein [Gemmataceae bacterium]